ncbi:MAG: TetR/AcrR family transcriptional regulator [Pseudonocardiales bacterium]|nr:TetR/AcrR family transcriptional regulator [Pseudonocardiales bacterium]
MSRDPLFDTLFLPTADVTASNSAPVATAADPSAAPVRVTGTRTRAGNAMDRTRAALLDGAGRAVEVSGPRITMAQVAAAGGVAKATLYNHFRTREAVLSALVVAEVERLVGETRELPLADALETVARRLSTHPGVRAVARLEPGVLARLAAIDLSADGWRIAREAVAAKLHHHGRRGADTVLRLLASYLVSPAGPSVVAADVALLLAGLPSSAGSLDGRGVPG